MAHQNRRLPFLNATASSDTAHLIIIKACFGFLAVTTGIMVYSSFRQLIENSLPPWAYYSGMGITCLVMYLIIDHGLDSDFMDHWRTSDQLRNKTVSVENKRAAKSYLRQRGFMLWLRFALTLTSSIWAGAEIANLSTTPPDYEGYAAQIMTVASGNTAQDSTAQATLLAAETAEAGRIDAATLDGDNLVDAAVASGNIHQRSMYRSNPGFFYPAPKGQYFKSNDAYGKRIAVAKDEKQRLVASAKSHTATARAGLQNVRSIVAADTTTAILAGLSTRQAEMYNSTISSRALFVRWFDIVAAIIGLVLLSIRHKRLKAAGWEIPADRRNLSSLLSQWADRMKSNALCALEEALNLDIDGDGTIGDPDKKTTTLPRSRPSAYSINPRAEIQPPDTGREDGYFFSRAATPPRSLALSTVGAGAVATGSYSVATGLTSPSDPCSAAIDLLRSHRSVMATLKTYAGRFESETAQDKVLQLEAELVDIASRLGSLGWGVEKKPGRTGRYYLSPI